MEDFAEKKRILTPDGERIVQGNSVLMVPESRYLTLRIPIGDVARTQVTDKKGTVLQIAQMNEAQWTYVEKFALELLRDRTQEWLAELITPELDFWPPADIFPDSTDESLTDEEANARMDWQLECAGSVIGILDAIMAQIDEEIGKRDV